MKKFVLDKTLFVEVAAGLAIRGIMHIDYSNTRAKLSALGLYGDGKSGVQK